METVVKLRPYRTHDASGASQFITGFGSKNKQFEESDLAKSGLEPDDMLTSASGMIRLIDGATAGYTIPYFDLKGNCLMDDNRQLTMWRTKFELPVGAHKKLPKYLGPSMDQLAKHQLPISIPYVPPQIHSMPSKEIICAEGEKKTASIIKLLRLPAFGIGGCQMWRHPDGTGAVHPWILELLRSRGVESILIVPDGDVQRYDIAAAYGTFARALEASGEFRVEILRPPGKIDDLLVEWGGKRNDNWSSIPKLGAADLVQSPRSLISQYALAFKSSKEGTPTVHQHTSNIMRLMENHPAFPRVWLNEDTNTVMFGDEIAEPNKTDMEIANYFQYNLGFDKVTDRLIHNCVATIARTNRKSPFLDWIRSREWDGQKRLDHWLAHHWGCEDSEYTREVGSKWLVSACARLDKPGTKIDWMFITVGPQETGKTTMPRIMFKGLANPLYGVHNDKDLHMLMHSTLCTIFDELDSFGKREASNLKAMVTTNEDMFRPPYGISVEIFPRRFTLYGCGNRHEFLQHDPSGYRRFAVVEVTRLIDFKRLEAERDQLWAEAWYRYNNEKIDYWRVNGAGAQAQKHVIPNVFEEKVNNWIQTECFKKQGTNIKDGILYFTVQEILDYYDEPDHRAKELAGILRSIPNIEAPKYPIPGPLGGKIKKRFYKIKIED